MKCINCGADIQDTALFCNYCGQKQGVMINEDFDPDKTVSVFDNPPSFAQNMPTPPVTPQPAAPAFTPQPAVKPAVPVVAPKQESKKGLFGFFKKQASTVAPAKPVAPVPPVKPVVPAPVASQPVVEPAPVVIPEPVVVAPQPVVMPEPVVVTPVPVVEEPVKKEITDKDIYEMAQSHTPHDLTAPETARVFNAVLSQLVPAFTGVEKLETAMLSTPPADIKKNIAAADNDTLFVAIKALNYKLSQGCDPAVLSHVIQRIYKVLKARLS